MTRFETALSFAARLHAEQKRKDTEIPYISHLLAVAGIALEHGATEDEAIAALLHDAIEDQGGKSTEEVIQRMFGEQVAKIVRGCTDADVIPKPSWEVRKKTYLHHLETVSDSVLLVSAADKLHNVRMILSDYRHIGEKLWARFNGGREGTLWYYRALADVFNQKGPKLLAAELELAVSELERLTKAYACMLRA